MENQIEKLDVGMKEDMLQGIIDMVCVEWHCIRSFQITGENDYLELKSAIRDMRQKWLEKIVKPKAENFCITKHLCSVAKTKEEVGNRLDKLGKKEEAKEEYEEAGIIYGLIKALNEIEGGDHDVSTTTK